MGSQSVMDGLARTQDEEPFGSLEDKDPLAAKYITVRVWFVVSKTLCSSPGLIRRVGVWKGGRSRLARASEIEHFIN